MNSKIFSMNRTFLGSNLVTISKMWLNNPLRLYASIYRILLRLCKLNNLCASIAVEKSFVCYWNLLLLSIRKSPMCFCPFWCTHHHAIQEFLQKCHQNFLLIFPKEILNNSAINFFRNSTWDSFRYLFRKFSRDTSEKSIKNFPAITSENIQKFLRYFQKFLQTFH